MPSKLKHRHPYIFCTQASVACYSYRLVIIFIFLTLSQNAAWSQQTAGGNDPANVQKAEMERLWTSMSIISKKTDSLNSLKDSLFEAADHPATDIYRSEIFKKLTSELDHLLRSELQTYSAFVSMYKDSSISVRLIYKRALRDPGLPIDSLLKFYYWLSDDQKKTEEGVSLMNLLNKIKKSQIGYRAPDFSFSDMNGMHIKGKDLRENKYVLLDFWASWCLPCRQEIPGLKKIAHKYAGKLNIVSISIDRDTSLYLKAIKKDGMDIWTNGLINQRFKDSFFIPAIPMKYLINDKGVIVGKWRGGGNQNAYSLNKTLGLSLQDDAAPGN